MAGLLLVGVSLDILGGVGDQSVNEAVNHDILGDVVNPGDDQDDRQGAESTRVGIGAQGCRGESFFHIALSSIFQLRFVRS